MTQVDEQSISHIISFSPIWKTISLDHCIWNWSKTTSNILLF